MLIDERGRKLYRPKAVIGTNSWGSAIYEKVIRGSVVDNDTLKQSMDMAVKSDLLFVDSARDYGFSKGPKLIGMCCPKQIKISSKYTPFPSLNRDRFVNLLIKI